MNPSRSRLVYSNSSESGSPFNFSCRKDLYMENSISNSLYTWLIYLLLKLTSLCVENTQDIKYYHLKTHKTWLMRWAKNLYSLDNVYNYPKVHISVFMIRKCITVLWNSLMKHFWFPWIICLKASAKVWWTAFKAIFLRRVVLQLFLRTLVHSFQCFLTSFHLRLVLSKIEQKWLVTVFVLHWVKIFFCFPICLKEITILAKT